MALGRFQVEIAADSLLARDRIINTLYFDTDPEQAANFNTDWDALAEDLAEIYNIRLGAGKQITVKAYDMADAQPRFPKAEHTLHQGQASPSSCPREVAICLSYAAEQPTARRRGRIFTPAFMWVNDPGPRPTETIRNDVLGMATAFGNLGGTDVDWVVYSPTTNQRHKVKTAWVDDEWDTQRSRGLRSTTRAQTTLDE